MQRRALPLTLALLVTAVAAAGCLQGALEEPPKTHWYFAADACDRASVSVPVDKKAIKRRLPVGFEPVDASDEAGFSQQSGAGVLTLTTLTCDAGNISEEPMEQTALALVTTPIQPPKGVAGDAERHAYAFTLHTDDPTLLKALRAMGYGYGRAPVTSDLQMQGPASGGTATVVGADFTYTARLGGGEPVTGPDGTRVYHKGDRGLIVFDHGSDGDQLLRGGAQLDASEGSFAAEVMGQQTSFGRGLLALEHGHTGIFEILGGNNAS